MKNKHTPDSSGELRFTQNFLRDSTLVKRLVNLAEIAPGSTVLEIGPGKGIITHQLVQQVSMEGRVIAIELDSAFVRPLQDRFSTVPQVEIMNLDILRFNLETLPQGYSIFSNVPFNITSALLEHLFNPQSGPIRAHLILQKDAIMGTDSQGARTETFKSFMIEPLYRIELVHTFSKSDFVPQPGVETALFSFDKRPAPLIAPAQYDLYKDFLAFISKDRVGEGVWRKVFSKNQLHKMADQAELIEGRGLKSQSLDAIMGAFRTFVSADHAKQALVKGAMSGLREEQKRREQINREGGHRR